jgi:hypothetical protein
MGIDEVQYMSVDSWGAARKSLVPLRLDESLV